MASLFPYNMVKHVRFPRRELLGGINIHSSDLGDALLSREEIGDDVLFEVPLNSGESIAAGSLCSIMIIITFRRLKHTPRVIGFELNQEYIRNIG